MPCVRYCQLVSRYPSVILLTVATLATLAVIASVNFRELPDFTDPRAGFETRGSELGLRLNAWRNLVDSVSHLGPLTTNPKVRVREADHEDATNNNKSKRRRRPKGSRRKNEKKFRRDRRQIPSISLTASEVIEAENRAREAVSKQENSKSMKDGKNSWLQAKPTRIVEGASAAAVLEATFPEAKPVLVSEEHQEIGWMCGEPMADYAHIVFETVDPKDNLFTHDNIVSMCTLESSYFRSAPQFKQLCETKGPVDCCPGWNLGGYIALLTNRTSCFGITPSDVKHVHNLIGLCAKYYHSGALYPDCRYSAIRPCNNVPSVCSTYNAIYAILHYLIDKNFIDETIPFEKRHLKNAVAFLPVARSSATLDLYKSVAKREIRDTRTKVVAMDLGLKETLFNEYLFSDAISLAVASLLILMSILAFTQSFFLTIVVVLAIFFGLCLAYACYTFIFGVSFFPFMNVLAVIIAVGVGADDSFILLKTWNETSKKPSDPNTSVDQLLYQMVRKTLSNSWMSMLVTSITTAVAFLASYVSNISAIKCFSLFAGSAILSNLFLMFTWLPASLAFYQKYCHSTCCCCLRIQETASDGREIETLDSCSFGKLLCSGLNKMNLLAQRIFSQIFPWCIINLRYIFVLVFGTCIIASLVIVFHSPGLQLPDEENFQLFRDSHLFERYDLQYRNLFGFELATQKDIALRMPLRFVWGVIPADNGDYLNPEDRGNLVLDEDFDMAAPEAQEWMLKFCDDILHQPFFAPSLGPMLSNCFMKTFRDWMDRRCKDDLAGVDRTPCCKSSSFPFERSVFELCLPQAVKNLHNTPTDLWIPGVAGPKFNVSTNKVEAVIVEHEARQIFSFRYEEMKTFFENVDTWFQKTVSTAPQQLRRGFFISYLEFYDLQTSLASDTNIAILIAMTVALTVIFLSTFNAIISLAAVFSISGIIFVSIGILTLLGWELNVLESVAITLTIGLSVDFSLHYAVAFKMALRKCDINAETDASTVKSCITFALSHMCGPITMAALTTLFAGLCLLPTRVLAYIQIGTFIAVIMMTSWFISTFFFLSLLSIFGAKKVCNCMPEPDWSKLSVSLGNRILNYWDKDVRKIEKTARIWKLSHRVREEEEDAQSQALSEAPIQARGSGGSFDSANIQMNYLSQTLSSGHSGKLTLEESTPDETEAILHHEEPIEASKHLSVYPDIESIEDEQIVQVQLESHAPTQESKNDEAIKSVRISPKMKSPDSQKSPRKRQSATFAHFPKLSKSDYDSSTIHSNASRRISMTLPRAEPAQEVRRLSANIPMAQSEDRQANMCVDRGHLYAAPKKSKQPKSSRKSHPNASPQPIVVQEMPTKYVPEDPFIFPDLPPPPPPPHRVPPVCHVAPDGKPISSHFKRKAKQKPKQTLVMPLPSAPPEPFEPVKPRQLLVKKEPLNTNSKKKKKRLTSPTKMLSTTDDKETTVGVVYRRKNSYKEAQERGDIVELEKYRRKSMENLRDARHSEDNPNVILSGRNSASLGDLVENRERPQNGRSGGLKKSKQAPIVVKNVGFDLGPEKKRRHVRTHSEGNILTPEEPMDMNTKERRKSTSHHQTEPEPMGAKIRVRGQSAPRLKSSYIYERHPLSHSTTSVLNNESSKDPVPILPNRYPDTPDVWVPLKA